MIELLRMKKPLLHGYEVETTVELPPTPEGEPDYDKAIYRRFDCPTKEEAMSLARRLLPNDKWGAVSVTEFVREPFEHGCPVLHKEYVSDPEYVEA